LAFQTICRRVASADFFALNFPRKSMNLMITGAPGSGTTSLGMALAEALHLRHLDSDAYYWQQTPRPFSLPRAPQERLSRLLDDLRGCPGAVISGSVAGWGREVEDLFDLVVFLYLPTELRLRCLARRNAEHYGTAKPRLLQWAARYDDGPLDARSLNNQLCWLAQRRCPVLRLDRDQSVAERTALVLQALPGPARRPAAAQSVSP
jgi:adenylate kinase family enzyme